MIVGLGVDIFNVARMARELARDPGGLQKQLFTPEEIAYCEAKGHSAPHYAVRFAAKEALVKALPGAHLDFGSWREVEVRHDRTGRSHLVLHGRLQDAAAALRVDRMLLSLSHTREWAVASVVLESSGARAESVTNPRCWRSEPMDEVQRVIRDYVVKEYVEEGDDREVSGTTPLISGGIVDSFSMVSLKRFLEREFDTKIPDTEATVAAFDTVDSIAALVQRFRKAHA